MAATLSNVNLIVSDLDRALAFYVELLGLRVDADRSSPPGFVLLRAGACTLTIQAAASAAGPAGAGPGMALGFEVLDLNDVAARLTAAGYADAPVQTVVGWGRALQARDPDGHRLNLFTTREG
jgi:catechol 2,3-dioxygenase-like lactoylglutathione lyase family enzyme